MAGDWIKVETCTPDKPEVFQLAELLGIDPDAVLGKLFRIWIWADQQTVIGNAPSVTKTLLDRVTSVAGFADALLKVGWLTKTDSGFQFPNFERHNGKSAKQRSLSTKRVEKHRTKPPKTSNAPSVTKTLPEKRREEKSNSIYLEGVPSEVVIPKKMQSAEVKLAAAMWFAHLNVVAPDKLPMSGSPQEEAFWREAAKLGPAKFIQSVEHCVARGWINLRLVDDQDSKGGKNARTKRTHAAKDREDANADAFASLYASIGGEESGDTS